MRSQSDCSVFFVDHLALHIFKVGGASAASAHRRQSELTRASEFDLEGLKALVAEFGFSSSSTSARIDL